MLARHQLADYDLRCLTPRLGRRCQKDECTHDKSPDGNGWISHWRSSCSQSLEQVPNTARDLLRVGVHRDVEVTDRDAGHLVSQLFCSALPVAYSKVEAHAWEPFARLVLEGAYEATIWAGVLNAHATGSPVIYLTRLGGGAFGNDPAWIDDAMSRAFTLADSLALDIRIVSRR